MDDLTDEPSLKEKFAKAEAEMQGDGKVVDFPVIKNATPPPIRLSLTQKQGLKMLNDSLEAFIVEAFAELGNGDPNWRYAFDKRMLAFVPVSPIQPANNSTQPA